MPPLPASLPLKAVPTTRLTDIPGLPKSRPIATQFPKRKTDPLGTSLKRWHAERTPPKAPRNESIAFKAQPVKSALLTKVRNVAEKGLDPEELEKKGIGLPEFFGSVFSGLATNSYMQMQAEYRRRKASGRGAAATETQWQ